MLIEYKISFENGTVVIHHRVEPDVPSPTQTTQSNAAHGVQLGTSYPASSTPAAGSGNTPPTGLGGGGNTPATGLGGGNTPPTGLGGGGTGQGQVVVFGPLVIDASGLLAKNGVTVKTSSDEEPSEKKAQKPGQ
jgi:uncharacterized membrane protein